MANVYAKQIMGVYDKCGTVYAFRSRKEREEWMNGGSSFGAGFFFREPMSARDARKIMERAVVDATLMLPSEAHAAPICFLVSQYDGARGHGWID